MDDSRDNDFGAFARSRSYRVERWCLQKAGRVVSCEIRNDTARGGGWNVMLLEKGELPFSKLCRSYEAADYVAESWRQDYIRGGYESTERTI